ncbi:hypothetical protein [Nostoc commune]|nr:hypothetical protein [Nostoc commune]
MPCPYDKSMCIRLFMNWYDLSAIADSGKAVLASESQMSLNTVRLG